MLEPWAVGADHQAAADQVCGSSKRRGAALKGLCKPVVQKHGGAAKAEKSRIEPAFCRSGCRDVCRGGHKKPPKAVFVLPERAAGPCHADSRTTPIP